MSPAQGAPAAPVVPAAPPAVALAPAPPPAAGPGRVAPAGPADSLALTLDVLVYSEVPAERLVFINGRKYVEGQAVNGDAVVEQITPDGAVLRRRASGSCCGRSSTRTRAPGRLDTIAVPLGSG